MIHLKTQKQITNITKASQILIAVKKKLYDALVPGVSGIELNDLAEKEILKKKALPSFKGYHGFKHTICISFNEEVIHGIPSKRFVKEGDIVKIDVGCNYKGMHSDTAFTKAIGQVQTKDLMIIKAAKEALMAGINAIRPGARIGDISAAISKIVHKYHLYVPRNFSGHGIGEKLHEEPYIYNEGLAKSGPMLKDNMVICIEPMLLQKSNRIKILKDGWTVVSLEGENTAHYEHTILIKDGKPIILTKGEQEI